MDHENRPRIELPLGRAAIEAHGPWLARARLTALSDSRSNSWRFGTASSDEFFRTTSRDEARIISYEGECPMGLAVAQLREISKHHAEIAFCAFERDEHNGEVEAHWARAGSTDSAPCDDPETWFHEHGGRLAERWRAIDEATAAALHSENPSDADWALIGQAAPDLIEAPKRSSRQALLMLAGLPLDDPGALWPWPQKLSDIWLWPASPFTPRPHWIGDRDYSLVNLGLLSNGTAFDPLGAQASAMRCLDLAARWRKSNVSAASTGLAAAMAACAREALKKTWVPAMESSGPYGAQVFGEALRHLGVGLEALYAPEALAALSEDRPPTASALVRSAGWSYAPDDLALLARSCSPEIAAIAEQELLDQASGSGRSSARANGRL